MALKIDQLTELKRYLEGVLARAEHHGQAVEDVLGDLLVQVILRHDPGSVECRTYRSKPSNILRFSVGGKVYVLRYDHSGTVELRRENHFGPVVGSFSNATTRKQVRATFATL